MQGNDAVLYWAESLVLICMEEKVFVLSDACSFGITCPLHLCCGYDAMKITSSAKLNLLKCFQVPIQVNKLLAYSDGMKVVESEKVSLAQSTSSDGPFFTQLDR